MKKIVASVGLAALGASGLNTVYAQDMTATPPYKPWNVSAALRGFYDDNINTVPEGVVDSNGNSLKKSSFGFQISPALNLNWQNEQTVLMAGYMYTLRWYEKKPYNNVSHYDQDHTLNLDFSHAFSERYQLGVKDAFVVGQEPDILRAGFAQEEPQRIPGDNIRNNGAINFNAQITPVFGTQVGYANNYVKYHDSGPFSLGAELNRIENYVHLDGRWQVMPQTIGILGYQFAQIYYTDHNIIAIDPNTSLPLLSESRNSRAHYGYVGVDHNFLPDLSCSIRVGLRDTDYYNSPNGQNDVSPYVNASIRYNYTVESYAEAGFSYDRNATDVTQLSANSLTLDEDSVVLYGSINHRIIPNLFGNVILQFQDSKFNGGLYDGKSERFFLVGLNLRYQFNPYLSANTGYDYDKVDSDLGGRSYDRNRVYIGLTASY